MAIGIVAAGVLVWLSCAAGARQLVISEQLLRVTYSTLELTGGSETVRCPVTLEGSFSSESFPKTSGLRLGSVTRAALTEGSCTNGRARVLAETLPWAVQYSSFTGTLPAISSIALRLGGAAFSVRGSGLPRKE